MTWMTDATGQQIVALLEQIANPAQPTRAPIDIDPPPTPPAPTWDDPAVIVPLLRDVANGMVTRLKNDRGDYGLCDAAADEIERLRSCVAEVYDRWAEDFRKSPDDATEKKQPSVSVQWDEAKGGYRTNDGMVFKAYAKDPQPLLGDVRGVVEDVRALEWLEQAAVGNYNGLISAAMAATIKRMLARPVMPETPTADICKAMNEGFWKSAGGGLSCSDTEAIYRALYAHLTKPAPHGIEAAYPQPRTGHPAP